MMVVVYCNNEDGDDGMMKMVMMMDVDDGDD
jgi:hypothetical protein